MMQISNKIAGFALWALAVVVGCSPRAYVVSPVSADRAGSNSGRSGAPLAVNASSGAPDRVPSPEGKLGKQGSKPAIENTTQSIDFTAAVEGANSTAGDEAPNQEVALVAAGGFSGNETEHIKFSRYDPFGADGSFELKLDDLAYNYPIAGKYSSGYGARGRSVHTGVDLVAPASTPIYAVFDGVVRLSKPYSGYGNVIVLRHENGLETVYSHNAKNLVRVGQQVSRGDKIALCGRTGRASTDHLHFEVRIQGATINPLLLIDAQARTLQKGVLRVSRSSGGAISARRTDGSKPETAAKQEPVLAAATTTTTAAATTTTTTTLPAATVEREATTTTETPTASATASRGIRVGGQVYQVPESTQTKGAASSGEIYHTVAKGETLIAIGRKYGISWQAISKLNGWTPQEADKINAGKKIRVK